MPMIKLHSSCPIPRDLLGEISALVSETIGKSEQYVMVVVQQADMMMGGTEKGAVYAEVKSIGGLNRTVNHELTMKLCILLNDHLGIPQDRIYITFQTIEADHWGWNARTFG